MHHLSHEDRGFADFDYDALDPQRADPIAEQRFEQASQLSEFLYWLAKSAQDQPGKLDTELMGHRVVAVLSLLKPSVLRNRSLAEIAARSGGTVTEGELQKHIDEFTAMTGIKSHMPGKN